MKDTNLEDDNLWTVRVIIVFFCGGIATTVLNNINNMFLGILIHLIIAFLTILLYKKLKEIN
jgi:hypothetical protein